MIDHVYISVTDIEKSLAFYLEALKPLGWREIGNYDAAAGPASVPDLYGLGDATYVSGTGVGSSIWLRQRTLGETGLYRTYFAPGYYAANVADFDGNRLEFVHKAWNPPRQSRRGPSTLIGIHEGHCCQEGVRA